MSAKKLFVIVLIAVSIVAGSVLALKVPASNEVAAQTSSSGWDYVFVTPDNYYKIQGSSVRFVGNYFWPNERIAVTSNGTAIGYIMADQAGMFSTRYIPLPYGIGNRVYTFTGSLSQIPFRVNITVGNNNPWISLNTYYAPVGATLNIVGHQFGANETVKILFNGVNIGRASTDAQGNFSLTTAVPNTGAGQWRVEAVGETTNMIAIQPFSQSF